MTARAENIALGFRASVTLLVWVLLIVCSSTGCQAVANNKDNTVCQELDKKPDDVSISMRAKSSDTKLLLQLNAYLAITVKNSTRYVNMVPSSVELTDTGFVASNNCSSIEFELIQSEKRILWLAKLTSVGINTPSMAEKICYSGKVVPMKPLFERKINQVHHKCTDEMQFDCTREKSSIKDSVDEQYTRVAKLVIRSIEFELGPEHKNDRDFDKFMLASRC